MCVSCSVYKIWEGADGRYLLKIFFLYCPVLPLNISRKISEAYRFLACNLSSKQKLNLTSYKFEFLSELTMLALPQISPYVHMVASRLYVEFYASVVSNLLNGIFLYLIFIAYCYSRLLHASNLFLTSI